MRKVILQIDLTLDGYAADQEGKNFWSGGDDLMTQDALDVLQSSDAILLGRVAYQEFIQFWPTAEFDADTTIGKIAARINGVDKLIFSRTLDSAPWGKWKNARVVSGDIAEEIARLKAQPGKNLLLYAGANIVAEFMRLGQIDDYRLRVHPVVVGRGLPLFADWVARQVTLIEAKPYGNGVVLLRYEPEK